MRDVILHVCVLCARQIFISRCAIEENKTVFFFFCFYFIFFAIVCRPLILKALWCETTQKRAHTQTIIFISMQRNFLPFFFLCTFFCLLCFVCHSDAMPYQFLPTREGYVPVYIRMGDTPLNEINPDLAVAFHEGVVNGRQLKSDDGVSDTTFSTIFLSEWTKWKCFICFLLPAFMCSIVY